MENIGRKRFADMDLKSHVFIVTGGASGIGLASAEGLVEAGGKVYCLDRAEAPGPEWNEAEKRVVKEWGGSLHYERVDVTDTDHLNSIIERIAKDEQRLDGLLAAAGIVQVTPAVEYTTEDAMKMMAVNYNGVFMAATAAAREMMRYKCHGSICIIASMSGLIANKKMLSPVYNSSKAALIQLARNLAMEWSAVQPDGTGGIRVNCISPGHVCTPMVEKVLKEDPGAKDAWEAENMMHRLGETSEFKSAGLFLLSKASSFMTGNNLVMDGGHTAW
ncbi:hypothetical protein PRZ48_006600 [Zasmidium cellare]|uniref:Uncharacterized protein n=1 Tax=Zasmidium cellare TaxID=395010 RepID=A0ABR0ENU6_ZASCE|nr:hypothetical protein PRZ48_006600 [Zasmidium cellare]